jgi:caa(3)-type oxidase subunit IV
VCAHSLLASRQSLVWLVLVAATLMSFESMLLGGDGERIARCVILLIAFAKATIVGLEFMELRKAPAILRLPFLGWAVIACTALLVLSW